MATEIGTSIKRARERKRWSQQRLADALGVDRKTVDNWENGRTRPRSSIGAIEEVLGVSLDGEPRRELPTPAEMERLRQHIRDVLGDKAEVVENAIDKAVESGQSPRRSGGAASGPTSQRPAAGLARG